MGRCRWHRPGRSWPLEVPASRFLHGAVSSERGADGWVRPLRFFPTQLRALGSCAAWHPALFRSMARATSGITVEFLTDAREVALEVDVDPEPRGTAAQIELVSPGSTHPPFDGFSATVDGHHLDPCMPPAGTAELVVDLDDDVEEPTLPGMDPMRRVTLWLPALRGCQVRSLCADGTVLEPVEKRPTLLVLGDSISQGFLVGDPAGTWPAIVAAERGLDLVNQGVGGLVFQPTALSGLGALDTPAAVWVGLGANYRFERWNPALVSREIASYVDMVCGLWPDVPVFLATPTPHDEEAYPSRSGGAHGQVPAMIEAAAAGHPEVQVVDGSLLLEDRSRYFADADHPSARGARLMALRCGRVIDGEPPIDTRAAKAARAAERKVAALRAAARPAPPVPVEPVIDPGDTRPIELDGLGEASLGHLEPIGPASVGPAKGAAAEVDVPVPAATPSREAAATSNDAPVDPDVPTGAAEAGAMDAEAGKPTAAPTPSGADDGPGAEFRAGRDLEARFNAIARTLPDLDGAGRAQGARYLAKTRALHNGEPVSWAFTPKIFTAKAMASLGRAAETMYRVMAKTLAAYRERPEVREAFALPAEVERLCLIEPHGPVAVPVARVDVFLNEDDGSFQFCEVNCDGSSGMTVTDEVSRAVGESETFSRLCLACPDGAFTAPSVRDGAVDAVLEAYQGWDQAGTGPFPAERPVVAVVDYLESLAADEAADLVGRLEARGCTARITDIRDLAVDEVDGRWRLVDGRGPIDCVWRRVVLSEMVDKPCDGADSLVLAAEENLACLVGGFSTWPVATKAFFAFLTGPLAKTVLDADELAFVDAHVPATEVLSPESDLSRYRDRARWILKPSGGYNAAGVVAGRDVATAEEWDALLEQGAAAGAVAQAFVARYGAPVVVGSVAAEDAWQAAGVVDAAFMEGLFLFNGRFSGVFTRCGAGSVIGEAAGRLNMGCLEYRG